MIPGLRRFIFFYKTNNSKLKVVNLVSNRLFDIKTGHTLRNFSISSSSGEDRPIISSKKMTKPILYSYFRSSASWRVRIVLAHKGIDYEYKAVNLLKKEQLEEEYKKICPMGQVPSFKYDEKIITQSLAIMEFLEDMYPQVPMIPKDPFKKAKVREISDLVSAGIQPLQNLSVIMKYSEEPDKRVEWANYWMSKGFEALEIILKESSGKYCVGDEVTFADACLVPQAASASRFNVDLAKYPTVNRIYKTLEELNAFKKAHAFSQTDCPQDLRTSLEYLNT